MVQDEGVQYEEWLELRNGCLCCAVKDNGVKAIENLIKRRGGFDYIVLETTGLADPGMTMRILAQSRLLGYLIVASPLTQRAHLARAIGLLELVTEH